MYELEENRVQTSDPSKIHKMQYHFYSRFYTSNKKVNFGLKNVKGTKIDPIDCAMLESNITKEEF